MQRARTGAPSVHAPSAIPNAFTGNDVYIDPVLSAEGISIANVNFSPCARTHWHTHAGGQLLRVLAGSGWLCDEGREPVKINAGDVIWCPPGTTHWHGADDGSYMIHQAVSLGGVQWGAEIGDNEYGKKGSS
jgi:quercetin dioxygenase-like cupin family protein